jgi:hypothetical protein
MLGIYEPLDEKLQPNKVLVIFGPSAAWGKPPSAILPEKHNPAIQTGFRGQHARTQQMLGSRDFGQIISLCGRVMTCWLSMKRKIFRYRTGA